MKQIRFDCGYRHCLLFPAESHSLVCGGQLSIHLNASAKIEDETSANTKSHDMNLTSLKHLEPIGLKMTIRDIRG
jgi:hypothetical protein